MAERRELGHPKTACSLKEQLARTTLQTVRSQGHTYVELREDGKRFIFFCTLCLAPCYSDAVLLGHLNGNLHKERLSCAKITLLGPNPWPFNDGVLFFDNTIRNEKNQSVSDCEQKSGLLEQCSENDKFAIVKYEENVRTGSDGKDLQVVMESNKESIDGADCLVISGLLIKERTVDLEARFIGVGQLAARLSEKEGSPTQIVKIWCEWLGKEDLSDEEEKAAVPEHDFAIVTFSYFYNLGRLGLFEDPSCLLTSFQSAESENGEDKARKRKKSFSDPEDTSDSLCNQYDSSEEVSSAPNANSSKALTAQYDDHLLHQRVIKNKTIRRELRRQQQIFAGRICEICKQKMLPGKDAAAILNLTTGNLACSSRNIHGAFHLFHASCVIHWFLFCEREIFTTASPKGKKRCRKQSSRKRNQMGKGEEANGVISEIFSVFCPECQGTGVDIEGGDLERDTFPLSQMWRFQIKVGEGRKAWVKDPEKLRNCSTGLCFPEQTEESGQERVSALKRIRFYRVDM
ncbi:PREDICTED: uncharacterized protein LOC104804061 [Tarenaya hassleriana]|uniref:uncharacterized protein LOC104804061 n=1 Tax=Tarenaya hassleriana TaxID=28532 RepID=UPI00053C71AE|nr:PREDICTED: uncharacterized protein LOC104804061 [Tarenaya hassleriana]